MWMCVIRSCLRRSDRKADWFQVTAGRGKIINRNESQLGVVVAESAMITYTIGIILGIVPALLYGRIGGDEAILAKRPGLMLLLHYVHHWMLGTAIVLLGCLLYYYTPTALLEFVIGLGTGMAMDDLLFHSFDSYFQRKVK